MSKINTDTISKTENRKLAVYKPLIKHKKINYNFGKDYNNWFSDRFNFRKNIINAHHSLLYILTKDVINGQIDNSTGFLYMDWEFKHFEINIIKKNFEDLFKLNDFCKKNNIKLYILITPQKTDIYKPKHPKYITNENNHIKFLNYIAEQKKQNLLNIIYPYEELITASKNNFIFFKTEHHWTDDAAHIGYQELIKEIKKDYPYIKELSESDFTYSYNTLIRGDWDRKFHLGTTGNRIHVPKHYQKKYHNTNYRYYKHKDFNNLEVKTITKTPKRIKEFYYPKGQDLKVIMLGTSQNENLTEFIPFTFKYTKRLRLVDGTETYKYMKHYKEDILDFKPDILIYCITYSGLNSQKNIFAEE